MIKVKAQKRCAWAESPKIFHDYHDNEWGVPLHDDQMLFEMLNLEGAQAGLSWLTILRRRDGYRKAFAGFDKYIWQFVDGQPLLNSKKQKGAARSEAMSKDLKKRGFKFVGPTICYAYMQATGMVNDHAKDCFLYSKGR